jgi:hypothetical protein
MKMGTHFLGLRVPPVTLLAYDAVVPKRAQNSAKTRAALHTQRESPYKS